MPNYGNMRLGTVGHEKLTLYDWPDPRDPLSSKEVGTQYGGN